ncbi:hypothetical protein AAVH_15444 [Aphelenchoides avenae]|nr:hypothetical protein AAVH_15444 [Aphelenchus avenae]
MPPKVQGRAKPDAHQAERQGLDKELSNLPQPSNIHKIVRKNPLVSSSSAIDTIGTASRSTTSTTSAARSRTTGTIGTARSSTIGTARSSAMGTIAPLAAIPPAPPKQQ